MKPCHFLLNFALHSIEELANHSKHVQRLIFQSTSNLFIENKLSLFRLDCGTGPGVVKSSTQVHLHEWNHLSVFRHDWGVWIQLNGGKQEEGRSQVLSFKIKLNCSNKGLAQRIIGFNLNSWFA